MSVRFPPQGTVGAVQDWFLPINDLHGWPAPASVAGSLIFFLRRQPFEPWFALIATVGRKDPQRVLPGRPYRPLRSGELVCYFNDSPWAYGNNQGAVSIQVTDLSAKEPRR